MTTSEILVILNNLEDDVINGVHELRKMHPEMITPIDFAVIQREIVATHFAIRDMIRSFRKYVISQDIGTPPELELEVPP